MRQLGLYHELVARAILLGRSEYSKIRSELLGWRIQYCKEGALLKEASLRKSANRSHVIVIVNVMRILFRSTLEI